MLQFDPKLRPTAEAVLKHPWMEERARLSRRPLTRAVENLKGFHRGRMRLKACLLAVMTGLAGPETYGGDPDVTVGSRRQALKFMDTGGKVRGFDGGGGRGGARWPSIIRRGAWKYHGMKEGAGGRCTQFMRGRNRMTIDPRIRTKPARSTSGCHQPGRHCLHQARSAVRCSASRIKDELHPSKNRS